MTGYPFTFDTQHQGQIHDASLDYYGRTLATASADCTIRLWDVSLPTARYIGLLVGHEGPVWRVSWAHPRYGNVLASCSYDKKVIIWREETRGRWEIIYKSEEHTSSVNCVAFSPGEIGFHLAAGSSDGTVSVVSYNPSTSVWSRKAISAHLHGVLCLDWCTINTAAVDSLDENSTLFPKRLVTGGCDSAIRIWSYSDSSEEWTNTHTLNADDVHTDWIRDVAWRTQIGRNNMVVSCCNDGSVVLWTETDDGAWKAKQVIQLGILAWRVAWSITGAILTVTTNMQEPIIFRENAAGHWEQQEADNKQSCNEQTEPTKEEVLPPEKVH